MSSTGKQSFFVIFNKIKFYFNKKMVSSQYNSTRQNGFTGGLSEELQGKLHNSIEILNKTFSKYKNDEIFLSFNGGKDCTVLLHMVKKKILESKCIDSIKVVYVQPNDSFTEIEEFVDSCELEYGLKFDRRKGNLKTVIESVCNGFPYHCCLMGNRKSDPYCHNLNAFQETDSGWPKLMRVNPLLDWTYQNIWEYLIKNHVNYCELYNQGYTSIGDRNNTIENPSLKRVDPVTGAITYGHANELVDESLERAGRNVKKN